MPVDSNMLAELAELKELTVLNVGTPLCYGRGQRAWTRRRKADQPHPRTALTKHP